MIAAHPHVPARLMALFALLYAVQGVVVAYLTNFNKGYMIEAGVDPRTAGWVETAALSLLIFKFLLGPISDRFSPWNLGHRKPYIILGLAMLATGLFGLTVFHPGRHLLGFAVMAIVAVGGMCLFDTTCDGMVIDVTPQADRSRVQGLLQLSRFLATMVCTLGFGFWIGRMGPGPGKSDAVIWACSLFAMIPLVLAITVHEHTPAGKGEAFHWSAFGKLLEPHSLLLLGFGAVYGLVGLGVEFNLNRWYAALDYGDHANGIFGSLRYAGRAVGAILLPTLGQRMSRSARLGTGIVALAISTLGQAIVSGNLSAGFWAVLFGIANGWNDALFCVLAMESSHPALAASTFAVFMAASNVSIVGDALFLEMVHALGGSFPRAFLVCAGMVLALLAFVPGLSARPREEPAPDEGAAA